MDSELTPGQRAAVYWFSDGIPELMVGAAMTLFFGGAFLWVVYLRHWWMVAIFLSGLAFLVLLCWKQRPAIEFLKRRFTYPRTGYVRPPAGKGADRRDGPIPLFGKDADADENVSSFPDSVVPIWFGGFFAMLFHSGQQWGTFGGIIITAILLYAYNRSEAHRYTVVSLLPLIGFGIAYPYLGFPSSGDRIAPSVISSFWLLARGAITFGLYLRRNPRPRFSEGQAA